ncbi:uncharacterized protein YbjT (DUF2867 family) [Pseudoduganella flava]|uniref:NAD(P)H-binding protein n=1 Tax=Pseudoduganella flava TaxID=871742 RepID=A0A562PM51_9BURK|nr:NmrA family NAD(P)-binding protein [Pseudoduganella flava]QGZ40919.1 NAD(P)H-binding protein [Pseudoduganella flava]TWI45403.1 uncharacterized protein YbjT (DUF2867 family) [Pseudoduganella flava]
MTTSTPYAVFGVSGRTGAATADALLRSGQPVRVVVRDPAKGRPWAARGAEVAVADATDLAAMTRALVDVRSAYVINPQHYHREDLFELAGLIADTTARAAVAASVPRLVALSSVGADRESGTGWITMNRVFEQRLAATGIPTVFLRAAYFMENWAPLVAQAMRSGVLPTFLAPPQRAIPMVATVDVGSAAAAWLRDDGKESRAVSVSGPAAYAPTDVAAIVSAKLGKAVDIAVLPESEWAAALAQASFSKAALAGFTEMTRALNRSHIDMASDASAVAWSGTTALEAVIARLCAQS